MAHLRMAKGMAKVPTENGKSANDVKLDPLFSQNLCKSIGF